MKCSRTGACASGAPVSEPSSSSGSFASLRISTRPNWMPRWRSSTILVRPPDRTCWLWASATNGRICKPIPNDRSAFHQTVHSDEGDRRGRRVRPRLLGRQRPCRLTSRIRRGTGSPDETRPDLAELKRETGGFLFGITPTHPCRAADHRSRLDAAKLKPACPPARRNVNHRRRRLTGVWGDWPSSEARAPTRSGSCRRVASKLWTSHSWRKSSWSPSGRAGEPRRWDWMCL